MSSLFVTDGVSKIAELLRKRLAKKAGSPHSDWERKSQAVYPDRYYGSGGTLHQSEHLDIETLDGLIVGVWFRCQQLPFKVSAVNKDEVPTHFRSPQLPQLKAVVVRDVA